MSEVTNKELAIEIKNFLHSKDVGILSTIKIQDNQEFPYGSVCPFVTMSNGDLAILVSDIALHTKNMNKNENISFTVFDMQALKKQASARTSILAKAQRIEKNSSEYQYVSDTYHAFKPESKDFFEVHNFDFYLLKPVHIHYIKGFGKIYNFGAEDFSFHDAITRQEYQFAMDHMNKDHKDSIEKYLSDISVTPNDPYIINMNQHGFHIKNGENIEYLSFNDTAQEAGDLRKFLVKMAKS